jgi:hypothetical protein
VLVHVLSSGWAQRSARKRFPAGGKPTGPPGAPRAGSRERHPGLSRRPAHRLVPVWAPSGPAQDRARSKIRGDLPRPRSATPVADHLLFRRPALSTCRRSMFRPSRGARGDRVARWGHRRGLPCDPDVGGGDMVRDPPDVRTRRLPRRPTVRSKQRPRASDGPGDLPRRQGVRAKGRFVASVSGRGLRVRRSGSESTPRPVRPRFRGSPLGPRRAKVGR